MVQDGGVRAFAIALTGDLVRRRARLESDRRRCRHAAVSTDRFTNPAITGHDILRHGPR